MSSALALDAADGVIDGKFHGRQIVSTGPRRVGGYAPSYGGTYTSGYGSSALALDAVDGVIDGAYHGRPIVGGGAYPTRRYSSYGAGYGSSALALDAADGVIDGRSFGRPIIGGASRAPYYGSSYGGTYTRGGYGGSYGSSALALDAADGVIDGAFHGRPIVSGGSRIVSGGYGPSYGGTYTRGGYGGSYGSSALALDAADGVIDGAFHGRPIVSGGARSYGASYPSRRYSSYGGGYGYGAGSSALALDAADGVIDGTFHGRQIIGGGARPYYGSNYGGYGGGRLISGGYGGRVIGSSSYGAGSSALALDAADGVIDGRFHGRPIVRG